jgi:hypothetical protein
MILYWNTGIVEYWNIGTKSGKGLNLSRTIMDLKKLIPPNSLFQHSSIPSFSRLSGMSGAN